MQKRSALTAALSNKPGDVLPSGEELSAADAFSFPCLGDNKSEEPAELLEKLNLDDARTLAGSAAVPTTLHDGSIAVSLGICPPNHKISLKDIDDSECWCKFKLRRGCPQPCIQARKPSSWSSLACMGNFSFAAGHSCAKVDMKPIPARALEMTQK